MAEEKISILILTHNNMKSERTCFDGLKKLAERNDVLEIVILDNGSADGTAEYVKKIFTDIPKIKTIFSEKNLGCASGRKRLLEIAKGNIILFLDSDVEIESLEFIDKMLNVLKNPEIGITGLHGYILDKKKMEFMEIPPNFEGKVDFVSGFCQMFKKDIIARGCGIDCFYNPYFAEDADFCYQIKKIGLDVYMVPENNCGIIHKWSATNNGNYTENQKKLNYLFKKFNLHPRKNLNKKFFLLKSQIEKEKDKNIGRLGLFIKRIHPKLYFKIKKILSDI